MAGLYIHIPFCRSKCIYCDFYSVPRRQDVDRVIDGLISEYQARRHEIAADFDTIYIGGGTPSVLTPAQLTRLFALLPVSQAREITIEVNPDNVTPDIVRLWRELGINRVSIGVQSLDDGILRSIGRRHDSARALRAIDTLLHEDIDNISADMIYALPGLTPQMWENHLERILRSGIKHLSAYCLTYHEDTPLYRLWEKGKILPASDEIIEQQFDILRQLTAREGFEHYEISNFALPGWRSHHNSSYWDPNSSWLGIGPSAHSFDGKKRRIDHPDISRWIESLPTPFEIDEETPLDIVNDNIVTALRTLEGLDLRTVPAEYRPTILAEARPFIISGHMTLRDDHLAIHPSKWLLSDHYIRTLLLTTP